MDLSIAISKVSWFSTIALLLTLMLLFIWWVLQMVSEEEEKFKHIPGPPKNK